MIDARKNMEEHVTDAVRIAQRLGLYKADFQMLLEKVWHAEKTNLTVIPRDK